MSDGTRTRYRTIWISDIHLGTRSCKAELLLDFLDNVEADHVFLVGDIIDFWQGTRRWRWSRAQNEVVQRFFDMSENGTNVTFVPGNHDELFRSFLGRDFGNVAVRDRVVHSLADGRKALTLHGDEFDTVILKCKWLAVLGGHIYEATIALNNIVNWARKHLGLRYWPISKYLKERTKKAVSLINDFEDVVAAYARRQNVQVVVCGHIHKAEMRDIGGVLYCNDGDWVESCTALVEHDDGALELLDWPQIQTDRIIAAQQAADAATRGADEEREVPDFAAS